MNEYLKKYEELVYFRQYVEILTHKAGIESHHIKMRSLYPDLINDPSNIVELTAIEHILAHKYLMLWYKEEYGILHRYYKCAASAFGIMVRTHDGVELTIEEAAMLKENASKRMSEWNKANWNNPEYRKNRSALLSKIMKLRFSNPIERQKQSEKISKFYIDPKNKIATSVRIKMKYKTDPTYRINVSNAGKRRYSSLDERLKTSKILKQSYANNPKCKKHISEALKEKYRLHPEMAKKHSEDMKGRTIVYNIQTKTYKVLKGKELQAHLDIGWTKGLPIYRILSKGKNKGQLVVHYICPWKIDSCKELLRKNANGNKIWSTIKPIDIS